MSKNAGTHAKGEWAALSLSISDVTTPAHDLHILKWLQFGREAAGGHRCYLLALVLRRVLPGSAIQLHGMRRLMAAHVLRHWYLFGDVWGIRIAAGHVERPLGFPAQVRALCSLPR